MKILYLGEDDNYIKDLSNKLVNSLGPDVLEIYDPGTYLKGAFEKVIEVQPQLIILDNLSLKKILPQLLNLVRNCSVIPTKHFLTVVPTTEKPNIGKSSALGDMIYFVKSFEVLDVVYCIEYLLAPEKASIRKVARAVRSEAFRLRGIVRVESMLRKYAMLETNRLIPNTPMAFDFPYYKNVFKYSKHTAVLQPTAAIHSHFKFSYKLDYAYFSLTPKHEDRLRYMLNFKYELRDCKLSESAYATLDAEDKPPKKLIFSQEEKKVSQTIADPELDLAAKTFYFNWLLSEASKFQYGKENVVIYDNDYTYLNIGLSEVEAERVSIIMRHSPVDPAEEIIRFKPSILVYNVSEINTLELLKELVSGLTQVKDYFPYFMVFNYSGMEIAQLRDWLEYHFVVVTKIGVREDVLLKMLRIYREKKNDKELKKYAKTLEKLKKKNPEFSTVDVSTIRDHRVFKELKDEESLFFIGFTAELVWISEFEIVFITDSKVSPGEVLILKNPVEVQILIVPHLEGSEEFTKKNCYRGIIHWVDEEEKQTLRRYINDVIRLSNIL